MREPVHRSESVVECGLLKYHAADGGAPLMAVMV